MEVCRIAAQLGISQPNVSQHLVLLRAAGLVDVVRNGREMRLPAGRSAGHGRLLDHARLSRAPHQPDVNPQPSTQESKHERSTSQSRPSGTDDKLQAAAVLTAGAAALGREVHVFLQYWALDAFLLHRMHQPCARAADTTGRGRGRAHALGGPASRRAQTFRDAKEFGDVDIQACSLSMDVLGLSSDQLDPLVDGVEGVAAFYVNAGDGQVVFI